MTEEVVRKKKRRKKLTFWQVVKKKPAPIIGTSVVLTFLIIKILEFFMNWFFNKDNMVPGISHVYSLTLFYPFVFAIIFVVVTNYFKKKINGRRKKKNPEEKSVLDGKYGRGFTWRDIYRDREAFLLFWIVSLQIAGILFYITRLIGGLSKNHAVSSIGESGLPTLLFISAILSVFVTVYLENTLIPWLFQTKKGSSLLGIIVLVMGIITAYLTSGISYLWTASDELDDVIQNDFVLNLILPVDIPVIAMGVATLWVAYKARKCKIKKQFKLIKIGVIIAVVSMVISFTPIPTVLQALFLSFRMMIRDMGM